jgi:hypothetical protein
MSSKKNCSPACHCLIKKGEPTLEQWEEILNSAIDVFSSSFEETTLPDFRRQATQADVFGVCGGLNMKGFKVELLEELSVKQGEFYGLDLTLPYHLAEIRERIIGWGILRDRQVVGVTLTIRLDRSRYYFGLKETTVSQLILFPGVKPARFLWGMRKSAFNQVDWLKHKLEFAEGRLDYLDAAMDTVSVAIAPPAES